MKISHAFAACLLSLALAGAAWVYGEVSDRRAKSPKVRAVNYAAYRRNFPPPVQVVMFPEGSDIYYAVYGRPLQSPLALPSGRPVYIFDGAGRLVDYTLDSGDDPGFWHRWLIMSEAIISVARLDAILLPRVSATP